jgi:hypothetical protein
MMILTTLYARQPTLGLKIYFTLSEAICITLASDKNNLCYTDIELSTICPLKKPKIKHIHRTL